jgi:uncharacterized protein YgiB involved in biofilm formation
VDQNEVRVEEELCPHAPSYDDEGWYDGEEDDYYTPPQPGVPIWGFYHAGPGNYSAPEYGRSVRNTGYTRTAPTGNAYINPRGYVAPQGSTITRGGFGGGTGKAGSSGS